MKLFLSGIVLLAFACVSKCSHLSYSFTSVETGTGKDLYSVQNMESITLNWNGTRIITVGNGAYYTYEASSPTYVVESTSGPDVDKYGYCSASGSNRDGNIAYAMIDLGPIYKSTDYGIVWTQISPYPGTLGSQRMFAVNSTGQQVANCIGSDGVLMSYNYGHNWTFTFDGSVDSECVAISNSYSGQYLSFAGTKFIYMSSNHGRTWNAPSFTGNTGSGSNWQTVAVSGNGVYACGSAYANSSGLVTSSTLACSSDSGVSWQQMPTPPSVVCCLGFDETGANLFAVTTDGIYWSLDQGSTWTSVYAANKDMEFGSGYYSTLSVSYDGTMLTVIGSAGPIYGIQISVSDDVPHDDNNVNSNNDDGGGGGTSLTLGELIGIIVGVIVLAAVLIGVAIGYCCFQGSVSQPPPLAASEQL